MMMMMMMITIIIIIKKPNWTLRTYFGKYQCKITKHLNWEIIFHVA